MSFEPPGSLTFEDVTFEETEDVTFEETWSTAAGELEMLNLQTSWQSTDALSNGFAA